MFFLSHTHSGGAGNISNPSTHSHTHTRIDEAEKWRRKRTLIKFDLSSEFCNDIRDRDAIQFVFVIIRPLSPSTHHYITSPPDLFHPRCPPLRCIALFRFDSDVSFGSIRLQLLKRRTIVVLRSSSDVEPRARFAPISSFAQ